MAEIKLSKNQKILLTIRNLKTRITQLESDRTEPIAVVGLGCRFPGGGNNAESFWQLLIDGIDAIREVPADRWDIDEYFDPIPGTQGKMYTRWGGFLDAIDQFDPRFFGISPREASGLDPQQRLLLEVAWETMETSGQNPKLLEGTKTGVFIGITASDYAIRQVKSGDPNRIDTYFGIGNALNAAAGRISYTFGFQGPSISVDTACSSSLVSIHLACQSLRNRESDLALAGGVNLILAPESTIATSQAKMLSPTGRCRTFDESADGYVRGEGCGLVMLKRLSDVRENRDSILGLIRGSAVNQDGQSAGFTVPNGPAQQALIREALERSSLNPSDIGYIEAHGTGTSLGDPIEIAALNKVFGPSKSPEDRLVIGSVKTNIGHLESAAGIAGFIKTLLILKHKQIPAHLHLKKLSPHIAIDQMPLAIHTEKAAWKSGSAIRRAGVSSFGFSGTNAHIILEEVHPQSAEEQPSSLSLHLFTLSATSRSALRLLAESYRDTLQANQELSPSNLCYTASRGRSHFRQRLAIPGSTLSEIKNALDRYLAEQTLGNQPESQGDVTQSDKTAFLFTGQGSQYAGMGLQLYQTQPIFRYWIDECEKRLQPFLDHPLLSVIYGENTKLLDQTAYTQPALFALEYALYRMWESWGITPDAVAGHSVGEYVAACAAGIFSLSDGLKLISARGRLMQSLPEGGEMVAVFADERQVASLIEPYLHDVSIASVNAPKSIVISGSVASLKSIREKAECSAIKTHKLTVSHAFHSPLVDSIMEPFEQTASELTYHAPQIPLISNLTGEPVEKIDAGHWKHHLRQPVRFYDGMQALAKSGCQRFIELGPDPVLTGLGRQCLPDSSLRWLASIRKSRDDWPQLIESLAALYREGADIDWQGFYADLKGYRSIPLPTYPFQRQRYWKTVPAVWDLVKQAGTSYAREHINQILPDNHSAREKTLDRLCLAYFCNFLVSAGAFDKPQQTYRLDDLIDRLSILPHYRQLLQRWMAELVKQGLLTRDGTHFHNTDALQYRKIKPILEEADRLFRKSQPLISLVSKCGDCIGDVLKGQQDPLQLLFPEGSFAPLASLYQQTEFSKYFNGIIHALIRSLSDSQSSDTVIRILEIGAGTGSTTTAILPLLSEQQTRYEFTDVSEIFLQKARLTFADYPFLTCKKLDIEADVNGQGFSAGEYDLVIAANVLHATGDLKETISQVSSLVAPGGFLILWEITQPSLWFDTTFGLVLQELTDMDFRQGNPFIASDQWQASLADAGFSKFESLPKSGQPNQSLGQQVMLAQANPNKPGSPAFRYQRKEPASLPGGKLLGHPLLDFRIRAAHPIFQSELTCSKLPYLSDHRVFGTVVFPMSGFLEMALASLLETNPGKGVRLETIQLLEPLPLGEQSESQTSQVLLTPLQNQSYRLEIFSLPSAENDSDQPTWQRHLTSEASLLKKPLSPVKDYAPDRIRDRCTKEIDRASFYAGLNQVGLNYGPEFQRIKGLWKGDRQALADVSPVDVAGQQPSAYVMHPALLDSCFQTLAAAQDGLQPGQQQKGVFMPILIESVEFYGTSSAVTWCHAVLHKPHSPESDLLTGDIFLFDASDNLTLSATGFTCKRVSRSAFWQWFQPKPDQWLYTVRWQEDPQLAQATDPAQAVDINNWLILADSDGTGNLLAEQIKKEGMSCALTYPGSTFEQQSRTRYLVNPLEPADFVQLLQHTYRNGEQGRLGIICLWSMDAVISEGTDTALLNRSQETVCGAILHLIQAIQKTDVDAVPDIWLVTRGTQAVDFFERPTTLAASLWGMARVITSEIPGLRCKRIDLDPNEREAAVLLAREILRSDFQQEDQLAFRNKRRYLARLVRFNKERVDWHDHPANLLSDPFTLHIDRPGILDNLEFVPTDKPVLEKGEIDIEVHATGVNFRDVMIAMGVYPDDTVQLGAECAGIVVATGEGVTTVRTGDAVIAIAAGCYGPLARTRKELVIPKPVAWSFEEAATMLNVFLSAAYPLESLAKLQKGNRILIHSAAGGVGLAAIQIAKRAGAEIYATAGKPFKRQYLKSLGIRYVGNSRALDFADEIIEATGGEAIDIVVNSLTGESIAKSLSLLKPGGSFIELGKTGIWTRQQVERLGKNLAYFPIAMDSLIQTQPSTIENLLDQLAIQFEQKTYLPLPKQVFPMHKVADAFRFMQQANHIGKIVVSLQDYHLKRRKQIPSHIAADGTYLITGGLGGLGLLLAKWLIEHGARHLVLIGRNTPSAVVRNQIANLETNGATVTVNQADVSQWHEIKKVVDSIHPRRNPLKGVFHCAGILDDRIILNQHWEQFKAVLAPKVAGTWNLHLLTRNRTLDHFVLFSSVSALLGTPGQSNHAAANAFMDALAFYRQSLGLPALSLNWGPWSEVGAAARRNIDETAQSKGLGFINPELGMGVFEEMLSTSVPQVAIAPVSWPEFIKQYAGADIPPLFQELVTAHSTAEIPAPAAARSDILARYQQSTGKSRLRVLKHHILSRVSEVLGWKDPTALSSSESFLNLGLDSLMAVELKNIISQDLGKLSLPDTMLFDQPNVDALCDYLVKKIPLAEPVAKQQLPDRDTDTAPTVQQPDQSRQPACYPLTHAQKGIWFLYKLNPAMYAFNLTIAFRVSSDLDLGVLNQTLQELVQRHAVLRTRIIDEGGAPVQTILKTVAIDIHHTETSDCSEQAFRQMILRSARTPFKLEQDPLLRMNVFQNGDETILLIVIHHIIFDGASTGILLDEFSGIYQARLKGTPILWEPPEKSFAEYVSWQQQMLGGDKGDQLWHYWQQKLAGELPDLELPTDFPRPAVRSYRGAHHPFDIDVKTVDHIYQFCREEGCTLNMFMIAAFQVLLYRYSGQEDILTGSPTAGRSLPGFARVLGHFVNVVVVRGDLSGNPSFREFLKQMKQTVVEALEHQDFPFPLLVEKLNVPRDPSKTPVFQAALAFQSSSLGLYQENSTVDETSHLFNPEHYSIADQEGETDVTLEIFERARTLKTLLKYNPDLFAPDTIVRMSDHFNTLLQSILQNPEQPLSGLNILTDQERLLLLDEWQGKRVSFPLDKSISRLFELQVEATPEWPAVEFGKETLTYQDLNDRANQLAHYLKESGIKKERLVGVYLSRSPKLIISILAILKTGCAYVPLDPTHPEERTRYILEDSRPPLVLTEKEHQSKLKRTGFDGKLVDLAQADIWRQLAYNPEKFHNPRSLAYVIYTSGSTGKPKGVMLEHPGFVNMIYDQISGFGISATDRCLQFASSSFDVSLFEIFMPLLAGATLVLASDETIRDGLKLIRYLEQKKVTVAALTASYLRALDQHPLPTVRTLIVGGEPSDRDDVLFYSRRKAYYNAYGPTEISVCASYYPCEPTSDVRHTIPIGKPIANSEMMILDELLLPVPIGVKGEICIAGPGLARGYLNRPELTDAVFVDHPFKAGERLYKTGDIGRWLPDGIIEWVGRIDHQVKIRGYRIEIGEIESILQSFPEVHNAVVLDQKRSSGEDRLVAYLVWQDTGAKRIPEKLKSRLAEFLPDYMIPSAFYTMDRFPITASGKIDRKTLQAVKKVENKTVGSAPQTDTQQKLVAIWEQTLGKQQVGLHDNFFELGGDSLLAIQIVSKIYKEFNQELPVSIFFQNQTIEQLADHLKGDHSELHQSSLVTIQPKGNGVPIFCVHGAGGNVLCFKPLSRHLGEDRQFIGIQSTNLGTSNRSIKSMAGSYLEEIRSIREKGPYIIAGWCMGGCVALEIARELRRIKEDVTLILIDSFLMRNYQTKLWLQWHKTINRLGKAAVNRIRRDSGDTAASDPHEFGPTFRWKLFQDFVSGLALLNEKPFKLPADELKSLDLKDKIIRVADELNQQGVFGIPIAKERLLAEFDEFEANIRALLMYKPRPYDGETLLIKATEPYQQKGIWSTDDHGFSRVTSQLKIKEVPGDHFSMLNPPNVDAVAKALHKQLNTVTCPTDQVLPLQRNPLMTSDISTETIKEIVRSAMLTPTGDNCQPFRFAWNGKTLAVSHLADKARHHFNHHGVGSALSLGMLIESITIAARCQQLDTRYSLDLPDGLRNKVCAEIEFSPNPAAKPDELVAAIEERATDRRPYQGGDIQAPVFDNMKADAGLFPNCSLYFNHDFSKEILDYICKFETYTWLTQDAHHDVFEWIHYHGKDAEQSREGMPWQSLGVNYLESRILKLTRNYKIQTVLNKLGGLGQIKGLAKKMIRSSAALGCVTTSSLKLEDLTEAGRLAMRTWLSLVKNQWGLQPYALTSLVVFAYLMNPETDHFNPAFKDTFATGRQTLQDYFQIPANEYPCWTFRTGFSPNFPARMRTLRLPIDSVWKA